MLGWEFPPHISGGLGTACQGLARGVREAGVEVLFVVPRVFGDEPADVALLGVSGVAPGARAAAAPSPPPSAAGPTRVRVVEHGDGLVQVAVDSPLHPYDTPEVYERRLQGPATVREVEVAPGAAVAPRAPAGPVGPAGPPGAPVELRGGYGPDLMAEVHRYAEAVTRLVAAEDFDVVHAHDWMTFPAGIALQRATGRPLVVHAHALEYDRSGEQVDPRIRAIEQRGFDEADRIVCVSAYTASVVERRYGVARDRIRVVHNAVEARERGAVVRDKAIDEPIVLFLGRITFQKGPAYFLQAAKRVVEQLPGVKFVMAGTGDMFPRMVEQAAELGLAEHVHFTGFLKGDEVERMFAMADVYVMPSVSEPFGIAPLEALALDVPVIVSRQSGVAEVLAHALKVDHWDVDELADRILEVLTGPELRDTLVRGGRAELEQMQWSTRGRHLRSIYEEVGA